MGSIHPSILHAEHIAKRLSKADRKTSGVQTSAEAMEKAQAGQEDRLQADVRQYLNLHDIQFINPSMRKRSALPPGWPDFTLSYRGTPVAIECKTSEGRLSPDQLTMLQKLQKDGWTYVLAHSLADVQRAFREIEKEKQT